MCRFKALQCQCFRFSAVLSLAALANAERWYNGDLAYDRLFRLSPFKLIALTFFLEVHFLRVLLFLARVPSIASVAASSSARANRRFLSGLRLCGISAPLRPGLVRIT